MRILLGMSIAAVALATAISPTKASADEFTRYQTAQGGVSCKPTDSTSNSFLKAKSTGLRNEGSAGVFVICGMESTNSRDTFGTITGLTIGLYSLNGVSSTANCTAVNGYANASPAYSTLSLTVPANGATVTTSWDASNFGGVAGNALPQGDYWSITCTLPGNSGVGYLRTQFTVTSTNPV